MHQAPVLYMGFIHPWFMNGCANEDCYGKHFSLKNRVYLHDCVLKNITLHVTENVSKGKLKGRKWKEEKGKEEMERERKGRGGEGKKGKGREGREEKKLKQRRGQGRNLTRLGFTHKLLTAFLAAAPMTSISAGLVKCQVTINCMVVLSLSLYHLQPILSADLLHCFSSQIRSFVCWVDASFALFGLQSLN